MCKKSSNSNWKFFTQVDDLFQLLSINQKTLIYPNSIVNTNKQEAPLQPNRITKHNDKPAKSITKHDRHSCKNISIYQRGIHKS